uniref:RING-type domain-containing protein n=1 Tax=Leersia perrieri TaxID=77586 RepID=A0A0D9V0Q0_9ORYZ
MLEGTVRENDFGMYLLLLSSPFLNISGGRTNETDSQLESVAVGVENETTATPAPARGIGAPASDPHRRGGGAHFAGGRAAFSRPWEGSGRGGVGNAASAGMGAEEEEEPAVGREGGGGGGGDGGRDVEAEAEADGGDVDDGENAASPVVPCSICLDAVVAGGGERSTARLQCGHEFHLDCIGSAFNAKGVMQCPNCRQIESGNWLYANGSRPSQDVNNDEWGHDEDFYDASQPETSRSVLLPFRFQWCPIGRLAQLPSVFDFSSEPLPVSAPVATPQGPYIAYFQPLQSSASSSTSHVTDRTIDGTTYHDHWNHLPGASDGRSLPTVHPIDFHHNHWTHLTNSYSQPNNNNGVAEQIAIPLVPMRVGGLDSDTQQRGSLPSVYGNGSGSRSRIPSVPPMAPQFMRPHGNINEQYQQNSSSLYAAPQRSGGVRPLAAPPGPAVQTIRDSMAFSLFPQAPTGPNSMETEDAGGNQFYAWERDRFAPYPLMPVDSEASWWGTSQQSHGGADPSAASPRRLFGQWIGAGRSPPPPPPAAENRSPENSLYRQMHIPRM